MVLIWGCVIATNVVFIHLVTCYLNDLLIFNVGLIIYPIKNLLISSFVSSSQIKLFAIWNNGRQWLAPNNDCMDIWLKWFHLYLFWFFLFSLPNAIMYCSYVSDLGYPRSQGSWQYLDRPERKLERGRSTYAYHSLGKKSNIGS